MKYIPLLLAGAILAGCNGSASVDVEIDIELEEVLFPDFDIYDPLPFSDVSINSATFSGSGCPTPENIDDAVTISSDNKTLSVLFDEYIVESGDGAGLVNRSKCDIAISLNIPEGYQAILMDADYRLAVDLSEASLAEFTRQYFFAGGRSETFKDSWSGKLENLDVELPDRLGAYGGSLSECGDDVILRSKTSLYASVPHDGETAFIALDSLDFKSRAQFDYSLNYVRCN